MAFYLHMKQTNPRNSIRESLGCGECLMGLKATNKADAITEATAMLDEHDTKYQLGTALVLELSEDISTVVTTKRADRVKAAKEAQFAKLKAELGK